MSSHHNADEPVDRPAIPLPSSTPHASYLLLGGWFWKLRSYFEKRNTRIKVREIERKEQQTRGSFPLCVGWEKKKKTENQPTYSRDNCTRGAALLRAVCSLLFTVPVYDDRWQRAQDPEPPTTSLHPARYATRLAVAAAFVCHYYY